MSEKKKSRNKGNSDKKIQSVMKRTALGSLTGTAVFLLLIFIFALVNKKMDLSDTLQMIMSFFAVCAAGFTGGMICGKKAGEKGMINGLICSGIQVLIICVILLAVKHDLGLRTVAASVLTLLSGMAGGVVAVNKKKKRKI